MLIILFGTVRKVIYVLKSENIAIYSRQIYIFILIGH